jgi:hypothetical protein
MGRESDDGFMKCGGLLKITVSEFSIYGQKNLALYWKKKTDLLNIHIKRAYVVFRILTELAVGLLHSDRLNFTGDLYWRIHNLIPVSDPEVFPFINLILS